MTASARSAMPTEETSDYPRAWLWDEDGDAVAGRFCELGEAPTANGTTPVLTLEVAGERRSVFVFHQTLASKLREELERRGARDFEPGERIEITRGGWKDSANGRRYRLYTVRFPDRANRSAREILGAVAASDEEQARLPGVSPDDDVPF